MELDGLQQKYSLNMELNIEINFNIFKKELSKKIIANGGEVFFQKLDVTKNEECKNFAKAVLDKCNQ